MRFDVNNGTATMNISFSDGCSLMTLRFQCVGGVMDTLSLCSGRATRTAPFEVVGPPGDALEGNPVWLRLPIGMRCALTLLRANTHTHTQGVH